MLMFIKANLGQIFLKYEFEVTVSLAVHGSPTSPVPPKHRDSYHRDLLLFRLPAGPIHP